jgi:copper chaperone CopZ
MTPEHGAKDMQFHIPDMACDGCLRSVTLAIRDVDPGAQVTGDLGRRRVEVASVAARDRLAAALSGIGYPPTLTGDL